MNFEAFTALIADGDPAKHPQRAQMQLGGGASPVNVGVSVTNSNVASPGPWIARTVANTNAQAIDLRFIVSQLFRQDSKGIYQAVANLEIQMKPTGTTTWINPTQGNPTTTYSETGSPVTVDGVSLTAFFAQGNFNGLGQWLPPASPYFSITGKTTSPYVYELRIKVPNEGTYAGRGWDVRVRLIEKDDVENDPNFEKRTISWESLSAVYLDPIGGSEAWRGLSWLYVMGKATDQLTGIPEIGGPWKTKIVSVPPSTVFNPDARTYTGSIWDGSYAKAFTTDPAWIVNDLISDALFGISYLAPGSYLNKWDALEASKWFSAPVPDGNGGTQPRCSLNLVVDQPQRADELVQYMAGAVGAIAWDTGNGEWRMKVDKPETPVDIFTLENIEGDFNYSHTDIDSRFNDITLSFLNEEFDYREDRVRVWDQDHIDTYGRRPTTLVAIGCTNRHEAYRRAMLRLRTSIGEWRNVNFVTNRRGRLVRPLDTILVADSGLGYTLPTGVGTSNPTDLDQTDNSTTGRVVAYDAATKRITLRDTVRLEIGATYALVYASPNPNYSPNSAVANRDKPTITTSVAVTNTSAQRGDVRDIYLAQGLPGDIAEYATVAISAPGLPSMPRTFRVIGVEQDDDGERIAISAIEVDSGKWNASDNVDPAAIEAQIPNAITPPPLPPAEGDILTPTLIHTETQQDKRLLTINWLRPGSLFITGFRIGYTLNGGPLVVLAENFQGTTYEVQDPVDGTYEFSIWSVDRRGQLSQPLTASIELDELDFRGGNVLGPSSNRVHFSLFEAGTKGWEIVGRSGSIVTYSLNALDQAGYKVLTGAFVAPSSGSFFSFGTDNEYFFPVTPEERLAVQTLIAVSNVACTVTAELSWYDAFGDIISKSTIATLAPGTTGTFVPLRGFATAPAGALVGGLEIKTTANSSGAFAVSLARPMVNQASPDQTTFPSFTAGPNSDNGATRVFFRGDWEAGDEYREGDVVSHNGSSYACLVPHVASSGNMPPDATHWALFASGAFGVMLTNENHTVSADYNGVVTSFVGAGGDYKIFRGGAEITSGVTFSVASALNVTISIAADGIYTISGLSAETGTAVLRAVYAGVTFDKVYSINKSRSGAPATTFLLTNESHNVPTDSSGNGGDFSAATGQVRVLTITGDQIATATVGTATAVGCTGQVNTAANTPIAGQPKGYYRVTAMSADVATLSIPITYDGVTITRVFSLTKAKAGSPGQSAKGLALVSSRDSITLDYTGAFPRPAAQTTTFTANRQNSSASVVWNVYRVTGDTYTLLTASTYLTIASNGLSATMTSTAFNNARGSGNAVQVRISITDGTTLTDYITVPAIFDGAPAKSLSLIADRTGFSFNGSGAASPTSQTASIIASRENITETMTWFLYDMNGNSRSTAFLTGSGDARTMSLSQFESARNGTSGVQILVQIYSDGTTYSDYTTLLRVADGAAAVGFVQDSPTPNATFVNQTWYRPTSKTWWRASTTGTGGWVQLLGDLAALDNVGTGNIAANAVTQTVSQTSAVNASTGTTQYPNLFCPIRLTLTTQGGLVHVFSEILNELLGTGTYTSGGSVTGRFALTRGPSSAPITLLPSGSSTTLSAYLANSGTLQLLAPFDARQFLYQGANTNVWGPRETTALSYVDAPAAGTWTYAMWIGSGATSDLLSTRLRQMLKLMEVKR